MEGCTLKNISLIKFKIADYRPLFTLNQCACQIAGPLGPIKQYNIIHVQFRGRIYLEYLQLDHIKNGPVASIIDLIAVIIYMANHVR